MHVAVVALSGRTSPSGVCRHAANLALGLLERPSVEKVTMLAGDWQVDYLRQSFGLMDERLQMISPRVANTMLGRNLWYLGGLPGMIRGLRADVVHLAFPMPVVGRMFSAPVVASVHDLYPVDIPENFGRRRANLNRAALWLCLRNAGAIACVSATTHARLHEVFPWLQAEKTAIVPNAVRLRPGTVPALLPAELRSHPFLLCVAQHRANKNIGLLLVAFQLCRRRGDVGSATKLVIAGHFGPQTDRLRSTVEEHGLEDCVVFLRDLSDALLCSLYAACAIVVAPSLVEGFGLPIAEALSIGCRVVCSDIPAFREVGGDACTYFDPCDASGGTLAEAIGRGYAGGQHLGRYDPGSREGWPIFLTPEQVAGRYLDLYSVLLPGSKSKTYEKPGRAPASGSL